MPYMVTENPEGRFLIVKITGSITREQALSIRVEVAAIGKARGFSRYLLDVTEAPNASSFYNNYEFVHTDLKQAHQAGLINPFARIAVLVQSEDHTYDFPITVARNAGYQMRLFADRDAAIRHLLEP